MDVDLKAVQEMLQRAVAAQNSSRPSTLRTLSPGRAARYRLRLQNGGTFAALCAGCFLFMLFFSSQRDPDTSMAAVTAHSRRGMWFGRKDPDELLRSTVRRQPGLPRGFDWKAYLLWNPDARAAHMRTREDAIAHYKQHAKQGPRQYKKRPLLLRYSACQGLFNQVYAHMSGLILADVLGADVVLAPSVYRTSFKDRFSVDPRKNKVAWTPGATGQLLNVDAIRKQYARKGMKVYDTQPFLQFPDCNQPRDAYIEYVSERIDRAQVVRLPHLYLQSMHIWYIWDKAAEAIIAKHKQLVKAGFSKDTLIVIDLPCPFMSIMTLTCLEEAKFAGAALQFNATIESLAQTVLRRMRRRGARNPNGVHLRLEKDATDWAKAFGGVDNYLKEYTKAFAAAGFSQAQHLYVASGLLSYNATREMQDLMDFLAPFSKEVHYKEKYLKPAVLAGLNPEQLALLDFLVLTRTRMFVGLGSSSFSVYLREYRTLLGKPRSSNIFLNSRRIGTDPLFERCTHFAPLATE